MTWNFWYHFHNILELNYVRIFKILEMIQYTILGIFLGGYFGSKLETLYKVDSQKSKLKTSLILCSQLALNAIIFFYLRKVLRLIPSVGELACMSGKCFRTGTTENIFINFGMAMGLSLPQYQQIKKKIALIFEYIS